MNFKPEKKLVGLKVTKHKCQVYLGSKDQLKAKMQCTTSNSD